MRLVLFLALAGCATPRAQEPPPPVSGMAREVSPREWLEAKWGRRIEAGQGSYAKLVAGHPIGSMVRFRLIAEGSDAPIANALLLVGDGPTRSASASDADGIIVLPVDQRLLDENPTLVVVAPLGGTIVATQTEPIKPTAVRDATLESEPKAAYPWSARRKGIAGGVRMNLIVDDHGRVANATVELGPGHGLEETALDAMLRSTFQPTRKDGRAVWVTLAYNYTFILDAE